MLDPSDTTYELRIALVGVEPPIWRTFLVSAVLSLDELHVVLQVVMGWTNSHLYEFRQGTNRFPPPNPDGNSFGAEAEDEDNHFLCELLKKPTQSLTYTYDLGDGWEHTITLEAVHQGLCKAPNVLAGERACPPEDCGGQDGYTNLLEIIANPDHEEHAQRVGWLPDGFNPEDYPIAVINEVLAIGVDVLVGQFEGLADWGIDGEDDPKGGIQRPSGGPEMN